MQITIRSADRLPFPAVTVCNMNPIPRSQLLCSNYELATVDEYLTNYVQLVRRNKSLEQGHQLRFNAEPVSLCHNSRSSKKLKRSPIDADGPQTDNDAVNEKSSVGNTFLPTTEFSAQATEMPTISSLDPITFAATTVVSPTYITTIGSITEQPETTSKTSDVIAIEEETESAGRSDRKESASLRHAFIVAGT